MRALSIASLSLLCLVLGGQRASAQAAVRDLPPEFFSAQRGRMGVGPLGGFRIRYGRGLTAEGAGVLTTGINVLGPLLPSIINPLGAPMYGPIDPGATAELSPPQSAPACEPLAADPVLDALADATQHASRIERLDTMAEAMIDLVRCLGGEPVLPPVVPVAGDGDAVEVVPGGIIDRPTSPPSAAVSPTPASADCALQPAQVGPTKPSAMKLNYNSRNYSSKGVRKKSLSSASSCSGPSVSDVRCSGAVIAGCWPALG